MEQIILNILALLRDGRAVDDRVLLKLIHAQAALDKADKRMYAKRRLLPFYQRVRRDDPQRWSSWDVTPDLERRLLDILRMKPRRSASGVATITVITKPWPCGSDCLYCPNDVRMPKSYLHNEPACERSEQNFFDPYLQVSTRLTALTQMGHATDKVELIVLGGTWSDYPHAYQIWFVKELFRALNDGVAGDGDRETEPRSETLAACEQSPRDMPIQEALAAGNGQDAQALTGDPASDSAELRRERYLAGGFSQGEQDLAAFTAGEQAAVDAGKRSYNIAIRTLYGGSAAWRQAEAWQASDLKELARQQHINEGARHRVVGLVVETRPDAITAPALKLIRRLGATKVQMGIQSLDQRILDANNRGITVARIAEAFELLRAFGFKIHAHAMANLLGATPHSDRRDYERLVSEPPFQPDEVKLYPCALIGSARLCRCYQDGRWSPYTEEELLDLLAADVAATPAFCRISRMIRDFSSRDIQAGNKKPNLRQLVEERLRSKEAGAELPRPVQEIRFREVGTAGVDVDSLHLEVVPYKTSNTSERFLQWVAPDGRIAGFLRLSLPLASYVREHAGDLPVAPGEAMIREVHVYGMATRLGADGRAAQHLGLGRKLIERACDLARAAGYERINVISAVGTRAYYRNLGFAACHDGLYQQKEL